MSTLRVTGGQVLRPDLAVEAADVLVDREAGTVLEVGPDVGGGDETLDASGGLVIPGLVNAHTHIAMTLLRGVADDKPLTPWLEEDIWPLEAHLTPEDVRAGTDLGLLEAIRSGTTAFGDMYFAMDRVAAAVEAAGLRAVLGQGIITAGKDEDDAWEDVETALAFAEAYDGAADGRVQTAVMPHSLATVGEPYLEHLAEYVAETGRRLHYHANETVDHQVDPVVEAHGVRPLRYAADAGLLTERTWLAHCVHVTEEEVGLLADAGAAVAHCPASNMKLASGMAPVQRLLDAGATVGVGTDGAASNNDLDVFDELRDAAMVGKLAADDAAAVDAAAAVRLATAGGADALGLDAGRLEPGAAGDLAVVDLDAPHLVPAHDLVSHLAYAVRGSDVRHTVCDGRVLMRDREVLTLDEAAVVDRAREAATALVARAGG